MKYRKVLEKANINNAKEYAKALLESQRLCWDCDPILIEEFWAEKVEEFLKYLVENA